MDRSLKERLIGAVVLVVLGVWLIPWVLDGPERAVEAEPEALQLPASQGDTPMRTQTINLGESRDPPMPAVSNEARPASVPQTPAPSARTVEPGPVTAPTPQIESGSTSEGEGEAWMVQLGSFGEEENAKRLADRVSTFGFRARVSVYTASGRPMYRVRVGPEATRETAAAVASSLNAHGFVAQVVTGN